MNPLLISGFGTTINVDRRCLHIRNPHTKETHVFDPHQVTYDSIIIDGYTGNISFEAMRWLMKHNIQLTLLDWNGNLLCAWQPKETGNGRLRVRQYEKYLDEEARYSIAQRIVDKKVDTSLDLLRSLADYYEEVDVKSAEETIEKISREYYNNCKKGKRDYGRLLLYEGGVANVYWNNISNIFNRLNPAFKFQNRCNQSNYHNNNASDPINALLNYGYAILESQVRKCINSVGLDSSAGYLHEMRASNHPLVYDLQELYRWIVDLSVIELLQETKLKNSDFIVTENYHVRLKEQTAKALITNLKLNFNSRTAYKKKNYTYESILTENVQLLANFLMDKTPELNFDIPPIKISRDDNLTMREKILNMTPDERRKLGISKTTLWYMQKNLRDGKQIKIYKKSRGKMGIVPG